MNIKKGHSRATPVYIKLFPRAYFTHPVFVGLTKKIKITLLINRTWWWLGTPLSFHTPFKNNKIIVEVHYTIVTTYNILLKFNKIDKNNNNNVDRDN